MRIARAILVATALGWVGCKGGASAPPGAALLFDVDFSAPENKLGEAPTVYPDGTEHPFPSKLPSQIFLGPPKVVDAACGLEDQPALIATAEGEQGHAGLELLLDQRYGHYRVELDLCVVELGVPPLQANEPQLAIFLDIPDAYALGFFERGRLVIVDPTRGIDVITSPNVIGSYPVGKPMRVALDLDVTRQSWSVSIDGAKIFEGKAEVMLPRAVRIVMRGNKANAAAIDNLVIWAENDLTEGNQELTPPKTGINE